MKERYASQGIKNIGTEWKCVYTAPDDMDCAFCTGFMVSNTSDRNTTVESYILKGGIKIYLTSAETPLPAGSTAAIAALGQRIQLFSGDSLWIRCGRDDVADAMVSISEVILEDLEK